MQIAFLFLDEMSTMLRRRNWMVRIPGDPIYTVQKMCFTEVVTQVAIARYKWNFTRAFVLLPPKFFDRHTPEGRHFYTDFNRSFFHNITMEFMMYP